MKKFQLLSLLMMILAFTSCSSDNEPANLAESAIGSYMGYTNASCAYFSGMVADNQTVSLTSTELNKVNISFRSDAWGNFTINSAELTGSDGNIRLSGAGKSVMAHAGNAAKEYDCTVEGTIIGKNLELTISCPAVMGGLKIVFYSGDMPAQE